jgi:hypothetical protein
MIAVGFVTPDSPGDTATETVPPVTICPDHELLVFVPVTTSPPESVKVQFEKVLLLGPAAVHVVVPPRVKSEGVHVRLATLAVPPPLSVNTGQGGVGAPQSSMLNSDAQEAEMSQLPTARAETKPAETVATAVLLLVHFAVDTLNSVPLEKVSIAATCAVPPIAKSQIDSLRSATSPEERCTSFHCIGWKEVSVWVREMHFDNLHQIQHLRCARRKMYRQLVSSNFTRLSKGKSCDDILWSLGVGILRSGRYV